MASGSESGQIKPERVVLVRQQSYRSAVSEDFLEIEGNGLRGLTAPKKDLYFGNSGTSLRLFMGILAAQKFSSVLTGDSSLNTRPMERVAEPLRNMGAHIEMENDHAPVRIYPSEQIIGSKQIINM